MATTKTKPGNKGISNSALYIRLVELEQQCLDLKEKREYTDSNGNKIKELQSKEEKEMRLEINRLKTIMNNRKKKNALKNLKTVEEQAKTAEREWRNKLQELKERERIVRENEKRVAMRELQLIQKNICTHTCPTCAKQKKKKKSDCE